MTQEKKEQAAESFCDYVGDGTEVRLYEKLNDPAGYIVGRELRHAVNVALILGQPLLVTGEPGAGKTQLARRVAYELRLPPGLFPLTFNTKSTSAAKDLFYQYDALGHFQDAQLLRGEGRRPDVNDYITYGALGQAILLSLPPDDARRRKVNDHLPADLRGLGPLRSVVLIDEIDKAPRDLPNDVLDEIEEMSFTVRELVDEKEKRPGLTFPSDQSRRPVVIITSNSERDLPDAFLRRCVYFNIEFPNAETLNHVVEARLGLTSLTKEMRENAVRLFFEIRGMPGLKKLPATAELLSWLHVLERHGLDVLDGRCSPELKESYCALAKDADDLKTMQDGSDGAVESVRAERRSGASHTSVLPSR